MIYIYIYNPVIHTFDLYLTSPIEYEDCGSEHINVYMAKLIRRKLTANFYLCYYKLFK